MNTRQLLAIFCLVVFILAGCTAVPDPTPSPQTLAGEGVTVAVTRPLATATLPPTITPTRTTTPFPTVTEIQVIKDVPSTARPSPTPSPSATILARFVPTWAATVNEAALVNTNHVFWSPTSNQFIFSNCSSEEHAAKGFIFAAISPQFQPVDITSIDLVCGFSMDVLWHPEGHFFLISTTPNREDYIIQDINSTWKISQDGKNVNEFEPGGYLPNLVGWLNSNLFVQQQYSAGGHWHISITNSETGDTIATGMVHASTIEDLTPNFVITNDGMQVEGPYSAAGLSTEIVNPDGEAYLAGPYIKYLSQDYPFDFLFNSRFVDTLPGTNQILVVTWEAGEYLTDTVHTKTDLQLWNLDKDELSMLIPGGLDGQYSPDGNYLAYITYGTDSPPLNLLDLSTSKILLTQPYEWPFAFSPNGRTLTFYSPTPELILYDLETGEFLPPLTAVPYTPLWSPDSSRFVYQHPTSGLSIFDTHTNTAYPLASSGGERLANAQWSYDGTYLSVTVQQEEGTRDTAVLQIP